MRNMEFQYAVTWDGYSEGRDSGFDERKCVGAKDLDQCETLVMMHKDSSPKVYSLSKELDVDQFIRRHDEKVKKDRAEKQAALSKLTPRDRKVLGI